MLRHPALTAWRKPTNKQNRTLMSDFTAEKSENWRYPQFSVEPLHIGRGWGKVDVSFASFLCAREKEGKKFLFKERIIRELIVIFYYINFDKVKIL